MRGLSQSQKSMTIDRSALVRFMALYAALFSAFGFARRRALGLAVPGVVRGLLLGPALGHRRRIHWRVPIVIAALRLCERRHSTRWVAMLLLGGAGRSEGEG